MNKTIKIIATLLMVILLVATLNQVVLANEGASSGGFNYEGVITDVDNNSNGNLGSGAGKLKATAGKIIVLLRNIAAIAAVIILTVLGLKYMIGSTEERAEYKKSFIPLVVGIIVVVAATTIASFLFSLA